MAESSCPRTCDCALVWILESGNVLALETREIDRWGGSRDLDGREDGRTHVSCLFIDGDYQLM
jgi:hypothetical protein